MSEDDLQRLTGAIMRDGNLWAVLEDGVFVQITGDGASEDYRHLRNACLVMYRTLGDVLVWSELLITFLEAAGVEVCVEHVLRIQAAIGVSRRIAREGLENIANDRKPT